MTKDLDATTKKEWRELGFYYDFDEQHFHWRWIGSKSGLLGFARLIDAYVSDPRNQKLSEHEHYGPYAYLKLMTAAEPQITESWICGRLSDLEKLSAIVKEHLHRSEVGSTFTIGDEYVAGSKTVIQFEVRENNFDPASKDIGLSS